MKDRYTINDNGELMPYSFETLNQATHYLEKSGRFDHLASVVAISEDEQTAMLTIQAFYEEGERSELDNFRKAINEGDDKQFIFNQLKRLHTDDFITKQYLDHMYFALVFGGHATDEDFDPGPLKSFDDFCDFLIEQVEFAKNFDNETK